MDVHNSLAVFWPFLLCLPHLVKRLESKHECKRRNEVLANEPYRRHLNWKSLCIFILSISSLLFYLFGTLDNQTTVSDMPKNNPGMSRVINKVSVKVKNQAPRKSGLVRSMALCLLKKQICLTFIIYSI
jgi:hypothetical protein